MAKAKTFIDRKEDAINFEKNGEFKKAISTLEKALDKFPEESKEANIAFWIAGLEKKLEEKPEEKPEENDLDPNEVVEFTVTTPFLSGAVPYEVGQTVKLPRKNDFTNYLKEV